MTETSKSPEYLRIASLVETIQQHPTEIIEDERRLMNMKWFDYRFMSPKEANKLFMQTYEEIFRRKYAENVDAECAHRMGGVHAFTMEKNTRERSQLVAARQRADEFGMSYPVYIEAAFDFALRFGRERKRLPRPNQLHGSEKAAPYFVTSIIERWEERVSNGLVQVTHPAYLIENYRDLPAQDDFRQFILEYVQKEKVPHHRAIRMFTYERKQIPIDLFKSSVPEEQFLRAMEIVESDLKHIPVDEAVSVKIKAPQLWPTCFGMHYTHDSSSAECSGCPLISNCKRISDFVLKQAEAQSGVSDPASDYKRRQQRERQQRCRDRKREKRKDAHVSIRPETSTSVSA